MIYNEYAQVLETKNPETGKLYQPTDLNVINCNDVGHGDAPGRAVRPRVVAVRGRQRGHRDALPEGLVPGLDLLPDQPGRLRPVHGRRRLHAGHRPPGLDDERDQRPGLAVPERDRDAWIRPLWQQTVDVSLEAGIIKAAPPAEAFRTDLATAALAGITDDTKGADFRRATWRSPRAATSRRPLATSKGRPARVGPRSGPGPNRKAGPPTEARPFSDRSALGQECLEAVPGLDRALGHPGRQCAFDRPRANPCARRR